MNTKNYLLTTNSVVPAPKAGLTGDIDVGVDRVVVVSTDIKDKVNAGDYLVSITLNEVRRVVAVKNQDKVEISHPFSAALVAEPLVVVDKEHTKILYMELTAVGDTTFDEAGVLKADIPKSFGQPNYTGTATKFVRPVIVYGATANVNVDITFHGNTI